MKTVLVTGGARGIGAAICEEFAKEGYRVAVGFRQSAEAAKALKERLERSYGADVICVQADVSRCEEAEGLVKTVEDKFGFIDVLVNNAGISHVGLFTDTAAGDWDRVIATNLSSVYYCCHACLPAMIRAHKGCIINIASMWGEVGASCEVAYSASKAGVIGLSKALAKEVGPSDIRVNVISPGVIMTDMMKDFDAQTKAELKDETPLCRLGEPSDIAKAAVFLASENAGFITGQVLSVNGGFVI